MNFEKLIQQKENSVTISVSLTPSSRKNAVEGISDHGIRISVTGKPHEGMANAELIKFLAGILKVPKSSVEIIFGSKGRRKILRIKHIDKNHAVNILQGLIE
jgi:uncharacterized protein (TIGR00251 family)